MLVLARKRDEDTIIVVPPSDKQQIIVHRQVDVRGDLVRHGWSADDSVKVYRSEIWELVKREAALMPPPPPLKPAIAAHLCAVCHYHPVDAEDGIDTCDACLRLRI